MGCKKKSGGVQQSFPAGRQQVCWPIQVLGAVRKCAEKQIEKEKRVPGKDPQGVGKDTRWNLTEGKGVRQKGGRSRNLAEGNEKTLGAKGYQELGKKTLKR